MALTWDEIINLNWENQPFIKVGGQNAQQVFAAMGNEHQQVRFVLYPTNAVPNGVRIQFEIIGATAHQQQVINFCGTSWIRHEHYGQLHYFSFPFIDALSFQSQQEISNVLIGMQRVFPGGLQNFWKILDAAQ